MANKHFDESTYNGRFKKFLELTNAKHLLHSDNTIKKCQHTLNTPEQVRPDCAAIVAACVHPNTKKIIPFFGRMAFFVPINIPICTGMLLTAPTLPNLIGWQWFNQTYNAVFNFSNSAKSKDLNLQSSLNDPKFTSHSVMTKIKENPSLMKGYTGSVVVSVGLAVGISQWVKKGSLPPSLKPMLQKIVPFVATASAGMANVALMRSSELKTGIPVTTLDETYVGHSKIAARKALLETMASRALMPIPMLLLPAPMIAVASKFSIFSSSFMRKKITEMSFLIASIALGLPAALALYPQHTIISKNELEPEFVKLGDEHVLAKSLMYNKGV